ncbi:transmembrane protein, putative [Bodo saltans]|uniref:Transmembrane protein, putative n=1 Tax=Bodo saltans TaxID=75058 RepID=A0A0S4JCC2_BODSA|nr:transmembrane protein, putative [Bodo saltans]|eukprot:CUG89192.1 transmembrane protein, putative [Bodo saltans]
MSFLQGVTSFLESVDQKAGEMSRRTDGNQQQYEEDDDHQYVHHSTPDTSFTVQDAAASRDQPASLDELRTPAESAKLIQSLLQAQSQLSARHEKDLTEKHAQYQQLEKKLADLQAHSRAADAKVTELLATVDASQSTIHQLREELSNAKSVASSSDEASSALKSELHHLQEELQRSTDEKKSVAFEAAALRDAKKRAEAQYESVQSELNDYRRRVKFLLEEKDRRIIELENASSSTNTSGTPLQPVPSASSPLSAAQTEQFERSAAQQTERIASLEEKVHHLSELLALEKSSAEAARLESITIQDAKRVVQQQLDEADRQFEAERAAHSETRALKNHLDSEVESLQRELKAKKSQSSAQSGGGHQDALGLELRVRELAEMLMEKQAALEAKRSEADQWRTRFEVSQQRLREAESVHAAMSSGPGARGSQQSRSARALYVDEESNLLLAGDMGELGRTKFIRNLSAKGGWGEQVANAAQGLDKVSLKTGSFLRRNALLRVMLVAYVMMLHVWVFLVLTMSAVPSDPRRAVGPPV